MKKRSLLVLAALVVAIAVPVVAFAAELTTPAELVAKLTGKSVQEIQEQHTANKTYGQIAQENGVLEQFEDEMLELKKAIIDQRVKDGVLNQERGEELKRIFAEKKSACNGTPGENRQELGKKNGGGLGFGRGLDGEMGQGRGKGEGLGRGQGSRMGSRFGQDLK